MGKHIQSQICKCGRIHFAQENDFENYILVCKNCGMVFTVEWNRHRKMVVPHEINETIDTSRFPTLKISSGNEIFMETGNPATYYRDGRLADFHTKSNPAMSEEEVCEKRFTVNMRNTLRYIYPENIVAMHKHYADLKGFNWDVYTKNTLYRDEKPDEEPKEEK